ncbi:CPBP family intramembrane glutamic endopeptidase [Micromonospora humida]|uniref:CPBP family intramembrane glutamic endopeptidase n=1 Tax=Micromonospora humida TaxID=2809018 RepID=UPI003419A62C
MRVLKQVLAVAAAALVGSRAVAAVQDNPWLALLLGTATAVATLLAYGWVVRRTERREVTELARSGAGTRIVQGMFIGFVMFAAVIVTIALLGGYHVHGVGSVTGVVGLFGFMAAAAVTEELLFRGLLFRLVEERLGTWLSLLLTGVLFGLMHLANPDAGVWGATAVTIEAGFMLAACYVATGSLWVPIGLHLGWNFAAAGIFSVVVSGNGESQGLLDASTSGPMLLSGGDFGPEAGLYTVLAGLALTVVFLGLAHRRGRIVPRRRPVDVPAADVTVS